MSPLIFSLPVMYAVVGFCSPERIFSNVSADEVIVTSASPPPSLTVRLPSRTSTNHCPSSSMSNRYELLTPASFEPSTRDSSPSKNSLAATAAPLCRRFQLILRSARSQLGLEPRGPRRREERGESERCDRDARGHPHRRPEVDGVCDG